MWTKLVSGRLTGALNLWREEAFRERKAEARTTDGGENIFAFYERDQHTDGYCSLMDANGFCNYIHMVRLGKIDKEKARRKVQSGR